MGGPDRTARHQARQQQPGRADHALRTDQPRMQPERGEAAAEADDSGDQHQTQIVLGDKTREDFEHLGQPWGVFIDSQCIFRA